MQKNRSFIDNNLNYCYYSDKKEVLFMLIEYKVKNFMSYRDEIILSMVADKNRELSKTNVFKQGTMNLLKCAAIFGANASGKSNLIESFHFFNNLFRGDTDLRKLLSDPPTYRLDDVSRENNICYEISFYLSGIRHRYGIELGVSGIHAEWLYFVPNRQEACYFEREYNEITFTGNYFDDKKALNYIKPDPYKPFIFTLGQESIKSFQWAKSILKYMQFFTRLSSVPDSVFKSMLQEHLLNTKDDFIPKDIVVGFLQSADTGICDLSIKKDNAMLEDEVFIKLMKVMEKNSEEIDRELYETYMHHSKYNSNHELIGIEQFPPELESTGTMKFYSLIYPIITTLKFGGILLIDEIESSLHPLLCERIIKLFNSVETNPNHAQLIFTTHNTLLMNPQLLRRDQILFTEKNKFGASTLYSLYDIDLDIRSNFNYLNNYLSGRFGAIPYLGDFNLESKVAGVDHNETQTE